MKKKRILLVWLCILLQGVGTVIASEHSRTVDISVSLISHDLDGFFLSQHQAGIMPSILIDGILRISIPVMYTYQGNEKHWMVDAGGQIAYYPKGGRFWVGMTMLQNILVYGNDDLEEDHLWMHEILLGYVFPAGERITVTPCLVFRDPFKRYSEEIDLLQSLFPSYAALELGLHVGISLFNRADKQM